MEAEGIHVVSTDEMTGIQTLEHKYPDKLPLPGMCAKTEFPKSSWVFVCDGLNTPKSETLVRFTADFCDLNIDLGVKGKSRILKSMSCRAEFLHDPSHKIRFVYTPKHCSWMNQIEIWFGIINRQLLKRKSYSSVELLEESIRKFICQYNLTAHPFKWTYAGVPLAV